MTRNDDEPAGATMAALSPAAGLMLLAAALQLFPAELREFFRYERDAVLAGQVWRLLTANLIHLGWPHLVLNGCGLAIIAWLFAPDRGPRQWLVDFLFCGLAASLGLLLFAPQITWVVGLSGSLHGLFVVGALQWVALRLPAGKWLLVGVAAKILAEQWFGEIPLSAEIVGSRVITDAHLWGGVGGVIAFVVGQAWSRRR